MKEHIFICPFDKNLLDRLSNKRLVVKTSAFENIHPILQHVNNVKSVLHCIMVEYSGSLASVPFHESWRGIPVAIFANEMGAFKEVINKIRLIRDLSVRIFLNSDNKENFTALHILASLGIDCGIFFGKNQIDWEAMNDLMTYAVYGKVNHATIEPFQYVVTNYNPARLTDFSSVYFENPRQYIHIDKDENIDKAIHSWQEFFLKPDGCAYCQAWRVCMGKFSESVEKNPSCRQFFVDLMDAADHFLSVQQKNKRKELWQP